MRRRAAAAVVPAALLAALAVPLAAPAAAADCAIVTVPPHLRPGRSRIDGSAVLQCTGAVAGVALTVCIEEQLGAVGSDTWWQRGCATVVADGETDHLRADVDVSVMVYATYLRTTAVAVNEGGEIAAAEGPPVFWFNCACSIW